MKVLSLHLKPVAEERQCSIEEAQMAGELYHPNVVPSHALSVNERGELYFMVKLVEGQIMEAMLKGYENEVRRFDGSRARIARRRRGALSSTRCAAAHGCDE